MNPDPASLSNLRDIALPPAVSWWPPAFGWWVLAVGALAILLLLLARWVQRYHANAYRRDAERELRTIARQPPAEVAPAIAATLKRTALATYPRDAVAGLTGAAWAAFLARTGGFPEAAAQGYRRASLDRDHPLDAAETQLALTSAHDWVRRHRRSP